MRKKLILVLVCIFMVVGLIGCARGVDQSSNNTITEVQIRNLEKLGRVWGFVKYTHPTFILGHTCWDGELLELLPIIFYASECEVNGILYEWIITLSNFAYDLNWSTVKEYAGWMMEMDVLMQVEMYRPIYNQLNLLYEQNAPIDWITFNSIVESEMKIRQMADLDWIADEDYLGESLSRILSQFQGVLILDRVNAPVFFDPAGNGNFSNQYIHYDMDFSNRWYRLLGLFRLWNAMEYYFPYRDILDRDWHELLSGHIHKMLEGSDRMSYLLTLASLASNLHDAHVGFFTEQIMAERFGFYVAPVRITRAEGHLVVDEIINPHITSLNVGDVLLGVDGVPISEVISELKQYASVPDDKKILMTLGHYILRSHNSGLEVDILRQDVELSLTIDMIRSYRVRWWPSLPVYSHELLENNIGLINPARLSDDSVQYIMREFADTNGLIIDLRQYPSHFIVYELAEYLIHKTQPFSIVSLPSHTFPGLFIDFPPLQSGRRHTSHSFLYEQPVVILMNEMTMSQAEFTVMSLRNGSNVTVMGSNSIGSNGNITTLPLPGGTSMIFTGIGIFTPEREQTQRIGLSPDIYVERTIAGVRGGRDESIEAAIQFILEKR